MGNQSKGHITMRNSHRRTRSFGSMDETAGVIGILGLFILGIILYISTFVYVVVELFEPISKIGFVNHSDILTVVLSLVLACAIDTVIAVAVWIVVFIVGAIGGGAYLGISRLIRR